MNNFFLLRWYRSGCLGKVLAVIVGSTLLCMVGMIPVFIFGLFNGFESVSGNLPTSTPSPLQATLFIEPTTKPIIIPTKTLTATPTPDDRLSINDFKVVCFGGKVEESKEFILEDDGSKTYPAIAFWTSPNPKDVSDVNSHHEWTDDPEEVPHAVEEAMHLKRMTHAHGPAPVQIDLLGG